MIERPVTIDAGVSLVGIVTDPEAAEASRRPAAILLNAGLIHRVGPNRLHVRLARRLAQAGFLTLRLDLSGRGDSGPRRDGLSFADSGMVETREAMRHLTAASGVQRFVLMGICSGAQTAGDVAYYEPRVAGAVVIEGPAFATPRWRRRYLLKRLVRPETWWNTLAGTNALGRRLRRTLGLAVPPVVAAPEMADAGGDARPTTEALAAAVQSMVDRGVQLLAIFTGSTKEYNYAGQLADAFPAAAATGRLRERYFPQADHTFTRVREQDQVIDGIVQWMQEHFAAPAPLAPDPAAAGGVVDEEIDEVVL